MREIKFRAWNGREMIVPTDIINGMAAINKPCDLNDKVMTDDDGVQYYCNWDMDKTTDYPLMQYTGLKDKTGVEIYEGDIIKLYYGDWLDQVSMVISQGHYFGYGSEYTITPFSTLEDAVEMLSLCIKVIGNIYENPELLEAN